MTFREMAWPSISGKCRTPGRWPGLRLGSAPYGGGDHVGDQFDDGAGPMPPIRCPGTALQHGAYAVQCGGIRANVVNQFPFFRGQTGAGERAIHIRAADGGTHQGEFADGRQVNG